MATFSELRNDHTKTWALIPAGCGIGLFWVAMAMPALHRSALTMSMPQNVIRDQPSQDFYAGARAKSTPAVLAEPAVPTAQRAAMETSTGAQPRLDTSSERKIIRTSSLAIVVQHPAQVMDQITALAEMEGVSGELAGRRAGCGQRFADDSCSGGAL
jgi:hypothetical protein